MKVGFIGVVECAGHTQIYVANRVWLGFGAKLRPAASADIEARDIVLYVGGANGNKGSLSSIAKAVGIGIGADINANIYAPKGTLSIGYGAKMNGAFIARDIAVGSRATVRLDSGF